MSDYYFNTSEESTNVRMFCLRQRILHFLLHTFWSWAPRITEWLSMHLFFSPSAYRINAEEKDCLNQGRPFRVRVHDKTIQVWRWGHGPSVLMVHGWNGRGIQFRHFVAPLVNAGYAVIAIDGPAHGASSGRITSYFEFTDTIRALLKRDRELNFQGIIGHSFGASAAINALAKERTALNMVCLAPILNLQDLLINSFERIGLPRPVYTSLIHKFEKRFGYNLRADDPHNLMGDLCGDVLIVHDQKDRTADFNHSEIQAQDHAHISLFATQGLGHRRLLTDESVIQACLDHLTPSGAAPTKPKPLKKETAMEPIQRVLENYAAADEDQRLSMYLAHRDLRHQFTQIEMNTFVAATRPKSAASHFGQGEG